MFKSKFNTQEEKNKECDNYPKKNSNTSDAFTLFLILILLLLSGVTISHYKAALAKKNKN